MNPLPNILIEAYKNGYITKDNGEKIVTTSQVSEQEAIEIYEVVKHLQPENSCEVGFYQGFSGLSILQALEDNGNGTHYACDPSESTLAKNIGLENVKKAHRSPIVYNSMNVTSKIYTPNCLNFNLPS
tara:strand:+ start:4670 stop:5053 length:384 start_codon:yes stop_codon:yes gene_type:complete